VKKPLVLYLNKYLQPVIQSQATIVHITYPDGKSIWATPINKSGKQANTIAVQGKSLARDAREPGRQRKEAREKKLAQLFRGYFERLAPKVQAYIASNPQAQKAPADWEDDLDDEEFENALYLWFLDAAKDGTILAGEQAKIGIDYNLTNAAAARWAKAYITPFMKDLNKTTRDRVSAAVEAFIEKPEFTIGDAMQMTGLDDAARAERIAVTETTRAYSEGSLEYGRQLKEEYPDVRVTKTWLTNRDDLVCEICGPLDGVEIDEDEEFDDGLEGPPGHPACRCDLSVRTRI
jgi:hypothetical protein